LHDLLTILVVEDEFVIQELLTEALHDAGFAAAVASSGEDAIELIGVQDKEYRALVTDINLGRGKMDGWDVARRIREIDPEVPVVYMTGDSAAQWSAKGVPNSILITKPFASAQIVTAVSQLLNAGTPPASG
jgi:DNA-binding response OmpR family regulator